MEGLDLAGDGHDVLTHPQDARIVTKGPYCYQIAGLAFSSDRPLVGISSSPGNGADVHLEWPREALFDLSTPKLVPVPGGRAEVLEGARIFGRLDGHLEFEFDREFRTIRIWSPRESSLALTHDVVDAVIPLVLSTGPYLLLHGAALSTGSGGVALLGESGAGKSTFAAYWVRRGGSFLSDDWFAVATSDPTLSMLPSHPSIRLRSLDLPIPTESKVISNLWIDGYARHWMSFAANDPAYAPVALPARLLISYRRDSKRRLPEVRALSPRDGLQVLLARAFLLTSGSSRSWQHFLSAAAMLVARVPVLEVITPDGVAGLEALFDFIKERSQE